MMSDPAPACRTTSRRERLFGNPDCNGLDYLEVNADQCSLCVHFFGGVPRNLTVENIRIDGGRRIRDVRAISVSIERSGDAHVDDCLRIQLNHPGDFSQYRLCLVSPPPVEQGAASGERFGPLTGMDPRYACLDFNFKVSCPSELDCAPRPTCSAPSLPAPEINYLAKDYASFRQLMLDRLALTLPGWQERHAPDLGITLIELLAYAADQLSYYQDAVATEAYLDTARRRISVRRHARLVDYRMHEGCNARSWLTVAVSADTPVFRPEDFFFVTGFDGIPARHGRLVEAVDLDGVAADAYQVFEPRPLDAAGTFRFRQVHNEILLHTWGDHECCLPRGTMRATLRDAPRGATAGSDRILSLQPGDVLMFEEVLGPRTGNPADADPAHRHAVRLTKVTPCVDGLLGNLPLLEVEWAIEDALPFPLCLSLRLAAPDCRRVDEVSVARGNMLLVDHGRAVQELIGPVGAHVVSEECSCEGAVLGATAVAQRLQAQLRELPMTFAEPVEPGAAALKLLQQDVRRALPEVSLRETAADQALWSARYDLLGSGPQDRHVVIEIDDDGRAHLRFGDGQSGCQPTAGTRFDVRYRIGNGLGGNVGRDTITHMVLRNQKLDGISIFPRNPLPARSGTASESCADVKLFAPHALRGRIERAITAEDYAMLAARESRDIQRAAAQLRWTGSWHEMRVAIDPVSTETAQLALLSQVERALFKYRRLGHDLAVVPAAYVPLALAMEVCVLPGYPRAQVKARLLEVLGAGTLADGKLALFHPDNLSFGAGIHLSRVVAVANSVEGVHNAVIKHLRRLGDTVPSDEAVKPQGVLPLHHMEIAQLANDPSLPEHGTLSLTLWGGR